MGYIAPSTLKANPVISVLVQYFKEIPGSDLLGLQYKTSKAWSEKDEEILNGSKSGKPLEITPSLVNEFERTHANNVIILMLLLEILLVKSTPCTTDLEIMDELDILYQKLFGLLTAGLRKTIANIAIMFRGACLYGIWYRIPNNWLQ